MKTLCYSIIVIVALSMISTIVPHASAHGICTGLQSRYGRLDGIVLSNQTLQTGSTLTVSGKIVSSATNNMTGLFRIWSNSTTIGVWEVVSKEPYGYKINISPNDVTPFSITIKALKPGSYRISPQIYFGNLGAISLSDGCHREPKVVVTGNSIPLPNLSPLKQFESGIAAKDVKCMSGFQLILKSEDGSSACVKSDTINVLIEHGWAKPELYYVDSHVSPKVVLYDHFYDGIDKDNTTVSIDNQTYYQTTLNYAVDNLRKNTSILFHGVTFAFPEGIMVTPGGSMTILDVKFSDGSEEIYGRKMMNSDGSGSGFGIGIPSKFGPPATTSIIVLSNHMMPQAGITIFHDKIKLLVSK